MNKTKITLPVSKFGTLKSKYKPESNYISNDEFTVGSYNFLTNVNGAITKRPTDIVYNAVALTNAGKDQFEAIFDNGTHHLLLMDGGTLKYTSGDTLIHTVAAGYTATASMEYAMFQNRVYFDDGIDAPGVYDLTTVYGGAAPVSVPQVKAMGAQVPASAVTFDADSTGGAVPTATGHYYKTTFLYYGFEESNGGTISALHTLTPASGNYVVHLKTIPVGGYGVTARKIYRDNADGNFLLVGTISNNTATTFADSVSAGTTSIPVANNLPPTFAYIALNLSRLWVAGVAGTPSQIYWSNPGEPDIFDPDNSLQCNPGDPIQAIYVYQGITVVLNRHSIGQILGTTDDTFQYQQVPGSIGCVDTRSIQIRTMDGVPTLMWLSDRGIYGFNGSSVFYMSDPIEDEVSLNIQQVNFVTGSRSYGTQADWQSGPTPTPGIDLTTDPGTVTTINPTIAFQTRTEWETGTLDNIATLDGSNSIKVPTTFTPTLAQGTLGGQAYISGTNLTLPINPSFNGEFFNNSINYYSLPYAYGGSYTEAFAYPIYVPSPLTGTLLNIRLPFWLQSLHPNVATSWRYVVYADSAGSPGTKLYNDATHIVTTGSDHLYHFDGTAPYITISPSIISGTTYWIGIELLTPSVYISPKILSTNGGLPKKYFSGLGWSNYFIYPDSQAYNPPADYNTMQWGFIQDIVTSDGSWTSPVYDSKSIAIGTGMSVVQSGTYPFGTSGGATVYGSTDNVNWIANAMNGNYRWWYIRVDLHTDDNRRTPILGTPILKFNIVGTWISPVITVTSDGTSFISMPVVSNIPVGTSIVYTIATSANIAGPWTGSGNADGQFGTFGSAIIRSYAKVKAVLTTTSDDISTPSVTSLILNWNLVSIYTSHSIDIGQVPLGWGLFQDSSALNGGALAFTMKSSATEGGLTAATAYTVANGTFPNPLILPLQWTQFFITLTATPNNLPTVDSVTFNWFTGSNLPTIRVASLFVQKTYFLAAAEIGQPYNNIVIVYDQEGYWRLFRDLNINSLSLFFNQPFYCDAVRKFIYQWLTFPTGTSAAITMDVRTKAFDLGLLDNLKNVRSFRVVGINTGTTIHAYYSVDRGTTWIEMLNSDGTLGYVTTADGNKFSSYFVPDYSVLSQFSGTTVIFRVTSVDAFPCEIITMEPTLYIRAGKYLGRTI